MAVQDIPRREGPFVGDGEVRAYPFPFLVFKETDVRVVRSISEDDNAGEEELSLGTDYTVSLNEDQETSPGGTVRLTTPLPVGIRLSIVSAVEATQEVVLTNHDGFYPEILNGALDKLTVLAQELQEQTSRNLQVPVTSEKTPAQLLSDVMSAKVSADKVIPHIPSIETAADSIDKITTVADNVDDVQLAADNMEVLEKVASGLDVTCDGADVDYGHTTDPLATEVAASGALVAVANAIEAIQELADNLDAIIEGGEIAESVKENADRAEAAAEAAVGQLHAVSYETQTLKQAERIQAKANIGADYFVNVKDFGAKGDGVTDDTAAIQAAMGQAAATGADVFFPAGDYRVTRQVDCAPVVLFANGNASVTFDDLKGGDGFVFSAPRTVGCRLGVVGLNLICKGSNGGTCVKTVNESAQTYTYNTKYVFRDLFCRGYERNPDGYGNCWATGFEKWLHIGDCVGAFVENIVIQGTFDIKKDPAGQQHDTGIYLNANGSALTVRMKNLEIGPSYNAVLVESKAFFSLNAFDFIGTYNGVYQENTPNIFNEPKIWSGNINCQNVGIHIENSSSRYISSVTIRRHSAGWKGASNDWYGIKAVNSADLVIRDCMIQPDESGGAFTGVQRAIYAEACGGLRALGNCFGVVDIGLELSNCSDFAISDTTTFQNSASDVLFNVTNNTRLGCIGQYALVSSFAGTVLKKDSTIVRAISMLNDKFDLQSDGNVALDLTRKSSAENEKIWRLSASPNQLGIQAVSDDGRGTNAIIITRSGTTATRTEVRSSEIKLSGTVNTGRVEPATDGDHSLGSEAARYSQVYAATGTINTSDARGKTSVADIDEALMRAWSRVRFKIFQFKDAVDKKSTEAARLHVGVIAQQVLEAFASEGLDATRYGLLCYDAWEDQYEDEVVVDAPAIFDEEGRVVTPEKTHVEHRLVIPSGDRYGVRYEEALCLEAAYQRWRLKKIEEHLGLNEVNNESK